MSEDNRKKAVEFVKLCKRNFPGFNKPVVLHGNDIYIFYGKPYEKIDCNNVVCLTGDGIRDLWNRDQTINFLNGCKWISDYDGELLPEDYEPYGIIESKDFTQKPINPEA